MRLDQTLDPEKTRLLGGGSDSHHGALTPSVRVGPKDGLRRVSPVAVCPHEGLLTEPIAGARLWPQERVLMPLCRHSPRHPDRLMRVVCGSCIQPSGGGERAFDARGAGMPEELGFKGEAAAEYDRAFAHVTMHFIPFRLRAAHVAPGMRVLDIARGTGLSAEASSRRHWRERPRHCHRPLARMVEKARERLGKAAYFGLGRGRVGALVPG